MTTRWGPTLGLLVVLGQGGGAAPQDVQVTPGELVVEPPPRA